MELDELVDHSVLPEHLGHPEHEVGSCRALGELAGEPEPHHFGQQHVDGLADHGRLGFDATNTPSHDTEAVDHGGVAVGPDQAVRVQPLPIVPDHLGQVLEVDLVNDAGRRRHHPEVGEGRLSPFQELVALLVALEFLARVDDQCIRSGEGVDLHRVVDHEIGRDEGVHLLRRTLVTGHADDGGSHGGEVDDRGDAREVLEHHPTRSEGDLALADPDGVVFGNPLDVVGRDREAVVVAEHRLQEHLYRIGKPIGLRQ